MAELEHWLWAWQDAIRAKMPRRTRKALYAEQPGVRQQQRIARYRRWALRLLATFKRESKDTTAMPAPEE